MSHQIRKEKNCLNCGTTVEQRFCPKCGQENSINRPSFHYLFSHFAEDLVHYDSGFWKTMKTLIRKPGKITRDYLDGKRKTYVPPVKLYIFVSFVAFFLPYILPDFSKDENENTELSGDFEGISVRGYENIQTVAQLDSIQNLLSEEEKIDSAELYFLKMALRNFPNSADTLSEEQDEYLQFGEAGKYNFGRSNDNGYNFGENYRNIKSVEDFDSVHNALPRDKRMSWLYKPLAKKVVNLYERGLYENEEQLGDQFKEYFTSNLPKVLFIYLPFFAFFLYLFHGKKKWLYYDHGIFTLYYFSFLLILITFNIFLNWIMSSLSELLPLLEIVFTLINILVIIFSAGYAFFYFFRAHSRVYGESKAVSRFKSFILFGINSFLVILILTAYSIFTFMMI